MTDAPPKRGRGRPRKEPATRYLATLPARGLTSMRIVIPIRRKADLLELAMDWRAEEAARRAAAQALTREGGDGEP